MKVLHTSDWHLGDFPGPAGDNNTNARANDIKAVLEHIVSKSEQEQPALILIPGDLFNTARTWCDRALTEVQFIQSILYRLADIPSVKAVIAVKGTTNHDGNEHYETLKEITRFNSKIHIVNESNNEPVCLNIDQTACVVCIPAFGKTLYENGVSIIPDNADATLRNKLLSDALHQQIRKGLKSAEQLTNHTAPIILATHFTVTGCLNENGFTSATSLEPVIDPTSLIGYDLVCLGHIHRPQQVAANAFYAGAPLQLTFNDESQERGFYVHEFTPNGLISDFRAIETPHRFFTAFLDNAVTENLITNDYDPTLITADVKNKIVRVTYFCDADTQRNLNKALLEKAIYSAGAWYVDSISPKEVATKTNKNKVNINETPLDALQDWLTAQDPAILQNIDTEACSLLAEPIIEKVLASVAQTTEQGIFTPKRIAVKNYRNYTEAEFDYDDVKFCVINGQNGAGKSSLFMDTIYDAIFEDPREGDIKGWLNNRSKVRSGAITFEFCIGEKAYKIVRTRTKSGKLTLNISLLNPQNEWIDLSKPNTKETQTYIEQIIGLNAFTLKSCGLIMQADYGVFLQADRTARMGVLSDILGLSIYEQLLRETSVELTEVSRQITKLQNEKEVILNGLPDVDELNQKFNLLQTEKQTLTESKTQNENQQSKITEQIKQTEQTIAQITQLTSDIETARQTLTQKQADISRLTDELADLNAKLADRENIETDYNAYTAAVKQENFISHQVSLEKLHADAKSKAIEAANIVETSIQTLQSQIEDLEVECSDENIAFLRADVIKLEQINADIATIESKEAEQQALQAAHKARFDKFQAFYAGHIEAENLTKDRIKELNDEVERLKNSGCLDFDNANCEFIKAAKEAPAKIAKLNESLNLSAQNYNAERDASKAETDGYERQMQEIRAFLESFGVRKSELTNAAARLCTAPAALQRAENISPTLAQHRQQLANLEAQKQSHTSTVQNAESALTEIRQAYNGNDPQTLLASLRTTIETLKPRAELFQNLPVIQEKIKSATVLLELNNKEIETTTQALTEKQVRLNSLSSNNTVTQQHLSAELSEYKYKLSETERQLKMINDDLLNNAREQGVLDTQFKQIEDNKIRLADISSKLSDFTKLDACYSLLKLAFSQNGIPHNIIRKVIPALEDTACQILGSMTGNILSVKFVLDKTLKSKKEIITLDVVIDDTQPGGTGLLPYLSRSGGEKVKASLAVILALAELKATQNGTQLGFLFIDEPPFLDSDGVNAYCDALDVIYNRYDSLKIMAVTHDDEMKARFPQNIYVYKNDFGSHFTAVL